MRRPLAAQLGLALALLALGGCNSIGAQADGPAPHSLQAEQKGPQNSPRTAATGGSRDQKAAQGSSAGGDTRKAGGASQNANGAPNTSKGTDTAQAEPASGERAQPGSGADDASTVISDEGLDGTEPSGPYRPANLPELELTPPLIYQILAAEIALQRQQIDGAYNTFQSLAAQTGDARLARRATEVGLMAGALPEALTSARLWQRLDPTLPEANKALHALLLANGRMTEAEPALRKELETARAEKTLDTAYPQLQEKLLNLPDRQGAWALTQRLSAPDLDQVPARLTRARMAFEAGQREAAAEEALAAHRLDPNDIEAVLASVQLLQPLPNGQQRAAELLDQYLQRNPDDVRALKAQGLLQIASNHSHEAINTLNRVQTREPDNPVTLYTLAQLYFQQRNYSAATQSLERYLALPADPQRDTGNAWLFLAEIAQAQSDVPRAIKALEGVSPGSRQYFEAQATRATLLARHEGPKAGMDALAALKPTTDEERQLQVVARAQIMRRAKRFDEAYRLLNKAIKTQKDPTDLLYDHAVAAEGIGRFDIAEKDLRKLMKARPEDANGYNALGYMLADRNERLPEALQLIEKANQLLPDNPHILDSLAWVYYRLGRLDESITIFQKIWKRIPEVELGTHYGEVLWVKGKHEAARAVWRETQKLDPDSKLLRSTLKRLKVTL